MISFEFILPPLIGCLFIVLINVYFGIHVIKREIIFIDIALAQIAALGSVVGMVVFNISEHDHSHGSSLLLPYLFSLGFISIASYAFTTLKHRKILIPLEALIGIAYAVATTLAVIVLDKSAGSDVHVHDMLVGTIMWVSWKEVLQLGIVVIIVGSFHIIYRRKFMMLTDSLPEACKVLKYPRLWDFLFFFSFGVVVIEAVKIAGILTVFAFLVIPAAISTFVQRSWTAKLITGWIMGITASFFGLIFSIKLDVPSAPVIIVLLGLFLLGGFFVYKAKSAGRQIDV